MDHSILISLSSIVILGVIAQWFAWRFHLPAILLLLVLGFIAGPWTGLVEPDALFGSSLGAIVSLSVGIILFEGGLSLHFDELKDIGQSVIKLVSLGAVITLALITLSAQVFLDLNPSLNLLLGSVLVVTGPTVIIPMLRQIRLSKKLGSILKWEGIVIDPIGIMLAVLVFEIILSGTRDGVTTHMFLGIVKTVLVGSAFGVFGAWLLIMLLKRFWVPDFLQNPISLMLVVGGFTVSNMIQDESGLLTTTVMGVVLANQNLVSIKHIIEFKENLRVLLISCLFILLTARIEIADLLSIGTSHFLFLASLIFIVRPASVFASTINSGITLKEKLFLSSVAPRGIVAASISSVFAITLTDYGMPEAGKILPITFFVIFGTILFYSVFAPICARVLGLYQPSPQGVLFVGAHSWVRSMALELKKAGVSSLLVDTNKSNIAAARDLGLSAERGSIYLDQGLELSLQGVGRLLAMTQNDEVNTLACLHFADDFSRSEVYQLQPTFRNKDPEQAVLNDLRSRTLFGKDITYRALNKLFQEGATVEQKEILDEDDIEFFIEHADDTIPLFLVSKSGAVSVYTGDSPLSIDLTDKVIYIKTVV